LLKIDKHRFKTGRTLNKSFLNIFVSQPETTRLRNSQICEHRNSRFHTKPWAFNNLTLAL